MTVRLIPVRILGSRRRALPRTECSFRKRAQAFSPQYAPRRYPSGAGATLPASL